MSGIDITLSRIPKANNHPHTGLLLLLFLFFFVSLAPLDHFRLLHLFFLKSLLFLVVRLLFRVRLAGLARREPGDRLDRGPLELEALPDQLLQLFLPLSWGVL